MSGQLVESLEKQVPAVGIDFGTTNSLIATFKDEQAIIIPGANGESLVHSVVLASGNNLRTISRNAFYPETQVIYSIKRLLGKTFTQVNNSSTVPAYLKALTRDVQGILKLEINNQLLTPIEIASIIFKKLKSQAEEYFGHLIERAVVTVPAYFGEAERLAVHQAANLAGLQVLRLIAEPTAAALAYQLPPQGYYLVYDLGGGTFDISLIRTAQGVVEVLAVGGDTMLGGDDLDYLVLKYLKDIHCFKSGDSVLALEMARKLKEEVNQRQVAELELGEQKIRFTLEEFEQIVVNTIQYTINLAKKVINDAAISHLDGCILVGGSSKIKLITDKLAANFNTKIFNYLNPELVVALGAAQQAANLTYSRADSQLLIDVIPLSLGLEVMGGMIDKILPRNSAIPITVTKYFTTQLDNQTGIILHILQGEREMAKDLRSLAKFELAGIPPMKAGMAKLAVTFTINQEGLLEVKALEENTKISQQVIVNPTSSLTAKDIEVMLSTALANASEDYQQRIKQEITTEALILLNNAKALIEETSVIADQELIRQIQEKVNSLTDAINASDTPTIKSDCLNLSMAVQPLSTLYINQKLNKILQGKNIENF